MHNNLNGIINLPINVQQILNTLVKMEKHTNKLLNEIVSLFPGKTNLAKASKLSNPYENNKKPIR
jgi:hypothetical protein